MKQTALVIPYQGESRFRVASWVKNRFQALHPSWTLIVATEGGDPWTKPRAVNQAVRASSADLLVVADADIAVTREALELAVQHVVDGAAWAVPFSTIYRLDQACTAEVLACPYDREIWPLDPEDCVSHKPPYPAVPGGGVVVVARDAFDTVNGVDPEFEWGQEDASFGWALDTLAGPHHMFDAPLWHMWHQPRSTSPSMYDAYRLEALYANANGKPEQMRALINRRHRAAPVRPLRPR